MKHYIYNVTIFDTLPSADTAVFPRRETWSAFAETADEAQRQIVEKIWDPANHGCVCAFSTPDDAADRFHIVFDDEPVSEREVAIDESTNAYVYVDELSVAVS